MKDHKKDAKKVTAALLTHINMGKTEFTPDELEEELPMGREIIDEIFGDLEENGLFTLSGEGFYTVAADIGYFRHYYLAIDKQESGPMPLDAKGKIRVPAKFTEMCGYGQQQRKKKRTPPVVDATGAPKLPDLAELEEWLKDADSKAVDEFLDSVFGDDDSE